MGLPEEVLDDPTWLRSEGTEKGRDGARVPIPWKRKGKSFGFGKGGAWLPQPEYFGEYSSAAQAGDPNSMLELYRKAMKVRRKHLIDDQSFTLVEPGKRKTVLSYQRGDVLVVVNMGWQSIKLPEGEIILASLPGITDKLPANAAVWLKTS